jgi:hypothetical protein
MFYVFFFVFLFFFFEIPQFLSYFYLAIFTRRVNAQKQETKAKQSKTKQNKTRKMEIVLLELANADTLPLELLKIIEKFAVPVGSFIRQIALDDFYPWDLAVDDHYFYVADTVNTVNNRLVMVHKSKSTARVLFESRTGTTTGYPRCVAVDEKNIYVADKGAVLVFDKLQEMKSGDTLVIRRLGLGSGSRQDQLGFLSSPYGVAVDAQHVFVTDFESNRVMVFDKQTNKVVRVWGKQFGTKPGDLSEPACIAVDESSIWILDNGLCRIQRFNKNTDEFMSMVDMAMHYRDRVMDIEVDKTRLFALCSSSSKRSVKIFNKQNNTLQLEFSVDVVRQPYCLAVDPRDSCLWVGGDHCLRSFVL